MTIAENFRYSHAWQRFHKAVDTLATADLSLAQRLSSAWVHNLVTLRPQELPDDLRDRFVVLGKKLSRVAGEGGEGAIDATVRTMTPDELRAAATEIVGIYDAVCRLQRW